MKKEKTEAISRGILPQADNKPATLLTSYNQDDLETGEVTTDTTHSKILTASFEKNESYNNIQKTHFQAQKTPNSLKKNFLNSSNSDSNIQSKFSKDSTIIDYLGSKKTLKFDSIEQSNENVSEITGVSTVGIDTVKLYLLIQPRKIGLNHKLNVTPYRQSWKNRLLFIDSSGASIEGEKATYNSEYIDLTIRPMRIFRGYTTVLKNCGVCTISFSIAKIHGQGDNTKLANKSDTQKAFEVVAKEVHSIGIDVDLLETSVIRLDLAQNLSVSTTSVDEYIDVFKKIALSRKRKNTYDTTNLDFNKGESFSTYDKYAERQTSQTYERSHTSGLLRIEWQLKKSANIKKALGIDSVTVNQLINQLDSLETHYLQAIYRMYFAPFDENSTQRRKFTKGQVGHSLNRLFEALKSCGISQFQSNRKLKSVWNNNGWTKFEVLVKECCKDADKSQRDRVTRCLRELRKAVVREALENPDFARRYDELKSWLLKQRGFKS